MRMMSLWTCCALALALISCEATLESGAERGPLGLEQSRSVELRYLRFDVSNYEETLTREDILKLPQDIQQRLWLLDLDLSNGPRSPRLMDNALSAIQALDPQTLETPARNMQGLLLMTPDNADLRGTSLEQLIALSPLPGLAPASVLSDMLAINPEDPFLSTQVVTQTILTQVIATHPEAKLRLGPRTPDNPQGRYPVTPGSLPITLADVASDFETLTTRFGEYDRDGMYHPGFLTGVSRAQVLKPDFKITVRANLNVLPYKGVDLDLAQAASVSAVRSQREALFDFDDPSWLRIEGLIEGEPRIDELTFRLVEHDGFVVGGRSKLPEGQGSSPAWRLAPWTLEAVIIAASQAAYAEHSASLMYTLPGEDAPIFEAEVDRGWQQLQVRADLGNPPAPSYLWDLLLEVAQVRLHDGGLAEGQANAEFTLRQIPIGIDSQRITETIKANLRQDPDSLLSIAERVVDNTSGAADLYYYRPQRGEGDWLFFIAQDDIPRTADGELVRPYSYMRPGFYEDEAMTIKRSSTQALDGDTTHEKIAIKAGDVLYVEDDLGQRYRLEVLQSERDNRVELKITRLV